jgi:pantothenate kinase
LIVGVCGIPGAGKSTLSEKIQQNIPDSVIVPMDGFHLYRKELDEEGKKRRGASFTFNLAKFK